MRGSLISGGIGYVCFLFSYWLPLYRKDHPESEWLQDSYSLCVFSVILGSVIGGVGCAISWVAQGKYVSECANEQNAGFFNSVFWTFMAATSLVGNLMGSVLVTKVTISTLFLILTSICLVSVFVYLPLTKPKKSEQATIQHVETVEENKICETWKLATSYRMMVFVPIFAQAGQIIAFRAAGLIQMFAMTMEKSEKSTQDS